MRDCISCKRFTEKVSLRTATCYSCKHNGTCWWWWLVGTFSFHSLLRKLCLCSLMPLSSRNVSLNISSMNKVVSFSPPHFWCTTARGWTFSEAFTFCWLTDLYSPPMSALFSSKLLSTSSIWLPSQIRTVGLSGADGRVSAKPAAVRVKNERFSL